MTRGAGIAVALAGLAATAAAHPASPSPADALAQAQQQMTKVKSVRIGMTMSIREGGNSFSLAATGTELPARHQASLDMDLSQMSPGLGTEKVLMVGAHAYVHLAVLSTPAARKKGIKPWIVENASSALGVDPWSLGGAGGTQALQDIREAGSGVDEGVAVTRYTAKIPLRKAMATNPQFQKLVQNLHAPASLLNITANTRFDVDGNGYMREVTEAFTLRLPGQPPMALSMDFTLAGFDQAVEPIVAPPSYDVMSMTQFQHATGTNLPVVA